MAGAPKLQNVAASNEAEQFKGQHYALFLMHWKRNFEAFCAKHPQSAGSP
jgi:hypothetical protein